MIKLEMATARKDKNKIIAATLIFAGLILVLVTFMNMKNSIELRSILEESIKAQLISISVAARETLDIDAFASYDTPEDVERDRENYDTTLAALRLLANNVGAEYIYALKKIDDEYMFIFDTDTEDTEIFVPYDLSPVHEHAFAGLDSADVMNVEDEYGTFNTGAVPIYKNGTVIGIISADTEDTYLKQSNRTAIINSVILISSLVVVMGLMFTIVFQLLKRVTEMQQKLQKLAHYDAVTGLPNRQYLIDHLSTITSENKNAPFALMFIDLDNFKKVNDIAGHDAGDELLRNIGSYLATSHDNSKAFRPAAGMLNIAARIGGDEFIQIVPGVHTEEGAVEAAEQLMQGFALHAKDRYIERYGVGLSVGVALYPYHSDNFHVLIKYADISMYHAKRAGKNCYRIYQDDMKQKEEK